MREKGKKEPRLPPRGLIKKDYYYYSRATGEGFEPSRETSALILIVSLQFT